LRKLEDLIPEEEDLRWAPEPIVEFGTPADRILQKAAERDADLIVLGVRSDHIDASTHLPWATAHKVVARANCPVLTMRG
jgi:nucleotide-binding universal stress UspA family protein